MGRRDINKLKLITPKELSDDFVWGWAEGDYTSRSAQLQKLNVGVGCIVSSRLDANSVYYQKMVENYQKAGLDVGKGNAEFGYRMPTNQNGTLELIIFRRNEPKRR